jgi:hypothetical protein
MRAYYIKYCKILSSVIKEAKKQYYCQLLAKLNNQIKTTWNIIKNETGRVHQTEQIASLHINNENVRFEVFTAVTMKNTVFWVVTPGVAC